MKEMRNRRIDASSAGFTLVEVVMASVILVVALVPMAGMRVLLSRQGEQATAHRWVLERAINLVEEIRGLAPENVLATYDQNTYMVAGVEGANANGTVLSVVVKTSNLGKIVTVTLVGNWRVAGVPHVLTLETVIYDPLG